MAFDTDRLNAVVNNQDKIPFDVIFGLIIDPTFPIDDTFRTQVNGALAGSVHGMTQFPDGPLAGMLVSLNADGKLIAATGANKAFAIMGMDLRWDYFQTPGIQQVTTYGPGQADGYPVHYNGGRAVLDRYMTLGEGGAPLVYAPLDPLYRSTTGMVTKDSATDTTVIGQVLHIFPDGRLDVKFVL